MENTSVEGLDINKLSEQEVIRRESLEKLRELGVEPYPAAKFEISSMSDEILANYSEDENNFQDVSLAGRIMSRRIMGKAAFAELQDANGRIQIYVNRDEICPDEDKTLYNVVFKKLLDLGDFIGIKGHVFKTNSDTEVLVHLYEEYGTNAVDHLNGMFAFALWDAQEGILYLARDRMGEKPLYYGFVGMGSNKSFVFASQLKALYPHPQFKK